MTRGAKTISNTKDTTNPALESSLACAALGVRVLPVWGVVEDRCLCPDANFCPNPGKHPIERRWQETATTNKRVIERWSKVYTDCNFGLLTEDLHVIDIDIQNGGSLEDVTGAAPKTNWLIQTGSGGWHLGYRPPNSEEPVHNAKLMPGVDLKASGGMVVAPGSLHTSGRRYRILSLPASASSLVPWPTEGISLKSPGPGDRSPGNRADKPGTPPSWVTSLLREGARAGERNNSATRLAGYFTKKGLAADIIMAILIPWAERSEQPPDKPFGQEEISKIIASVSLREADRKTTQSGAWVPAPLLISRPPPPPERFGLGRMFYRGVVHWVSGEPDIGKSVIAYSAAVTEMKDGNPVVLLDEDAGIVDASSKIAALGAKQAMTDKLLRYYPPGGRDLMKGLDRLFEIVYEHKPTLIIMDAAADILSSANKDEDKAKDVTDFINTTLKPLAQSHGVCVIVIDHKTKANPEDRYGRGSGAKLAKSDVGYNVSAPEPFSRERSGRLLVTCTKDKPGYIGRETSWMVKVMVTKEGKNIILIPSSSMTPEQTKTERRRSRGNLGGDTNQARVLTLLQESMQGLTRAQIAKSTKLSPNRVSVLLNNLKAQDQVQDEEQDGFTMQKIWKATG